MFWGLWVNRLLWREGVLGASLHLAPSALQRGGGGGVIRRLLAQGGGLAVAEAGLWLPCLSRAESSAQAPSNKPGASGPLRGLPGKSLPPSLSPALGKGCPFPAPWRALLRQSPAVRGSGSSRGPEESFLCSTRTACPMGLGAKFPLGTSSSLQVQRAGGRQPRGLLEELGPRKAAPWL